MNCCSCSDFYQNRFSFPLIKLISLLSSSICVRLIGNRSTEIERFWIWLINNKEIWQHLRAKHADVFMIFIGTLNQCHWSKIFKQKRSTLPFSNDWRLTEMNINFKNGNKHIFFLLILTESENIMFSTCKIKLLERDQFG